MVKTIRLSVLGLAATAAFSVIAQFALPSIARSDEKAINEILSPGSSGKPAEDGAPATNPNAGPLRKGLFPDETQGGRAGQGNKEQWIEGARPINHLHLIAGHPLPGENCQQVIFDGRQTVKQRFYPKQGSTISLDLENLCLLGIRNDSDSRTFLVRFGEAFEAMAIFVDPQLLIGQEILPNQQIMLPIKSLPIDQLDFPIDLIWQEQINSDNTTIDSFTLRILGKK